MRAHDTLLGLLMMALAALVFAYTLGFPAMPGQRYGPALFPQVVCAGIFGCGLLIAWRGRRAGSGSGAGAPWLAIDPALREPRRLISLLAIPVAIGAYLLLAERLGFLPTAALIVGALAWWFGTRWWAAIVLGLVTSVAVHAFFASVMRVPLPRGWFMQVFFGG